MILWSGFILGLLGSTHCGLMCGPLSLAQPGQKTINRLLLSRIIYHSGRILTYISIGIAFGYLRILFIGQYQEMLSIIAGILIILLSFTFMSQKFEGKASQLVSPLIIGSKKVFQRFIHPRHFLFSFISGGLNGFLPCGLVYIALLGSISLSDKMESTIYMFFFGLGTLPMMLAIAFIDFSSKKNLSTYRVKIAPIFTFLLGLVLILRGLHLDIPYLSPALSLIYPDLTPPEICK